MNWAIIDGGFYVAAIWLTELTHVLDKHKDTLWQCSVCKAEGVTRNWQSARWDSSQYGLIHCI